MYQKYELHTKEDFLKRALEQFGIEANCEDKHLFSCVLMVSEMNYVLYHLENEISQPFKVELLQQGKWLLQTLALREHTSHWIQAIILDLQWALEIELMENGNR